MAYSTHLAASHPPRSNPANRVAIVLAGYAVTGGFLTLAGWFAHVPRLTDWIDNGISMFANTAVASICVGAGLLILAMAPPEKAHFARWPALIAAVLGGATMLEHVTSRNLRIDDLFVRAQWGVRAAVTPGRMGPPASLSFLALGTGIIMATYPRTRRAATFVGIGMAVLASLSVIGYAFHANHLFGIARYTGIALQTATILLGLGISLLVVIPEHEPVRTLLLNNGAGLATRRALPFVLLLPFAFAIARSWGEQAGYYDPMMGRSLLVVALTCVLCGLLWWCAAAVNRHESALQQHASEIEALNERLQLAMAETHHRVKNNLQVISAMIDMNLLNHEGDVPVSELDKIGQHVRSLAVIHDLLTQQARMKNGADSIQTKEIMDRLSPLLQLIAGDRTVRVTSDDFQLALRQGTSIAVLVNELVSNAVKHGEGDIAVTLSAHSDRLTLQVCDQGRGFPDGFDPRTAANTGIQLIETVCRFDLQGALSYNNRPGGGASVVVEFPWKPAGREPINAAAFARVGSDEAALKV